MKIRLIKSEEIMLLKEKGYKKASLAVQKDNYAVNMHLKAGFQIRGENEQEYIMICDLSRLS